MSKLLNYTIFEKNDAIYTHDLNTALNLGFFDNLETFLLMFCFAIGLKIIKNN